MTTEKIKSKHTPAKGPQDLTSEDIKKAQALVAENPFSAYTVYEQKRQEFRKAGTLKENEVLLLALSELAKHDGDKVEPTTKYPKAKKDPEYKD